MAQNVLQKVYSRTKFLFRKRKYLDTNTLKLLISALIQCHYDYACSSWFFGLSKKTRSKLQTSQNRLIRLVLGLDSRTHLSYQHFKEVNWLPVRDRVTQLGLTHMFNISNNLAPAYLSGDFNRVASGHGHSTRMSHLSFQLPRFRCEVGKCSFKYNGAKSWNDLPDHIKSTTVKQSFKHQVKLYLYSNMQDRESNDYIFY